MPIRLSCHCGAVVVTAAFDAPTEAIECNCSICRRKGTILSATSRDQLTVDAAPGALATYTFNKHVIQHHHCNTCGCTVFGEGEVNGDRLAMINLRCVDDLDLKTVKIIPFDGAAM
jgi:hypothetical protein